MAQVDTFALNPADVQVPFSILDTDLYKLTMQNAVLRHFPDAKVVVKFTNRAPHMLFTRECFDAIQAAVNRLEDLRLTDEERRRLGAACPYFPESYLDFLQNLALKPKEQVKLTFIPKEGDRGELACEIEGLWRECIMYEIYCMAIISEQYFKYVDTDWDMEGQFELAKEKALKLLRPPPPTQPIVFSEFGTRRRRSFAAHDVVMSGLIAGHEEYIASGGVSGSLSGTSNYGIKPTGSIAHEVVMATGALYGYKGANAKVMDLWEEVYSLDNGPPLTMLTDTYTAGVFFSEFVADPARALRWNALRQDSGDPFEFVRQTKAAWEEVAKRAGKDGHALEGKRVLFSDSLDIDRSIALQRGCDEIGLSAAFGIGTFFTNDFQKKSDPSQKSKPLNMVIKLAQIDGKDCIKLSDDKGKHSGNPAEVARCQKELGIEA